jgi:hypothetical protein
VAEVGPAVDGLVDGDGVGAPDGLKLGLGLGLVGEGLGLLGVGLGLLGVGLGLLGEGLGLLGVGDGWGVATTTGLTEPGTTRVAA